MYCILQICTYKSTLLLFSNPNLFKLIKLMDSSNLGLDCKPMWARGSQGESGRVRGSPSCQSGEKMIYSLRPLSLLAEKMKEQKRLQLQIICLHNRDDFQKFFQNFLFAHFSLEAGPAISTSNEMNPGHDSGSRKQKGPLI